MSPILPSPRKAHRKVYWVIGIGLLVAMAAIGSALGYRSQDSSPPLYPSWSSSAASPPDVPGGEQRAGPGKNAPRRGPVGKGDGVVPDGVTVFNDAFPAVARLDRHLLAALRQAATDAAGDGIKFYVNSGWRSPAYQNQLLREAVSKYGSEEEAARWVATASTSLHVKGKAVDIGHPDAAKWLSEHGARYGLCQIYRNESWHYELRANASDRGCPPMYADPTQDPRTRR
ncbi:M15 family metallopeptidase [Actinomadura luteofluorescens]|uniref:M15 family metallopeptidase n=1 Tax=Actinomadura luteofluorescens TaxID=46163 RepID=UPI0030D08195